MQTSRRCLDVFLTCNRASCFTRDVTHYHHWRVSSWVMWLRVHRATTPVPKQPFALFIFLQRFSPEWPIRTCSKITAVLLQCTDDDNRSYRNVCYMSFVSIALAVIFIIRLFSTSVFRVPKGKSYLLHFIYKFVQSKKSLFCSVAISSQRRFSIESCLCPEILVWFFLYSYVTEGIRLRSAVLPF